MKCAPIPVYGLEVCTLDKRSLQSLDEILTSELPSALLVKRSVCNACCDKTTEARITQFSLLLKRFDKFNVVLGRTFNLVLFVMISL